MRDSCYIILFAQNFDNGHGKFKLELSEYFQMNQCQLSFSMFYATSFSFLQFIIFFFLPLDYNFNEVKYFYIKNAYRSICDDYGVNVEKILMNEDWFYTPSCHKFSNGGNSTQRSLSDIFIRWIITELKDFTRTGIEKVSRSVLHVSI